MNLLERLSKIKFISLHFIFWVFVWLFYVYFYGFKSGNQSYIYLFSGALIPVTMTATYFVIYFLIPRYLLKKKYALFLLYGTYSVVFVSYIIVFIMLGGFVFLTKFEITKIPPLGWSLSYILLSVYLVVIIVSAFKLLKFNYESLEKYKTLENKVLETQLRIKEQELLYLKKQIHPHFLFNTLNTIYGFALRNAVETPEVILKLSNLLDYILYQIDKPKVLLKEEIAHVEEYIELEKIRFQDTLKVSFRSSITSEEIEVAPMLLIPFIENAFKHGSLINGFLTIDVNVFMREDVFCFSIRNTFLKNEDTNDKKGIGLDNFKKRLDLLYFENYSLIIDNENNWFCVELEIHNLTIKNEK